MYTLLVFYQFPIGFQVRIKAGQNFNFDVKVTGEPAPTTKWTLNRSEVKTGERTKVIHSDYNTKLSVRMATRSDTGKYTVSAENVNGQDSADVMVTVIGESSVFIDLHKERFTTENIDHLKV